MKLAQEVVTLYTTNEIKDKLKLTQAVASHDGGIIPKGTIMIVDVVRKSKGANVLDLTTQYDGLTTTIIRKGKNWVYFDG